MKSKVTIATAPCSWGVWYADGSPSGAPPELFLEQASQAGYIGLELGPDGYLPMDEDLLRAELKKYNFNLCAGTVCQPFDQWETFEDYREAFESLCKRVKNLGGKYIVAMDESDVGMLSEKKKDFAPKVWDDFFDKVRAMRDAAKEQGLEVVWHPHIKSMIETEEEIVRLMEETGLNLCFDTGHHAYANGSLEDPGQSVFDFMKKYPEKITYLHFKNLDETIWRRVNAENLDVHTAFGLDVMCDLELGMIDFVELKTQLDKMGFEGIGVIEQDMPKATPDQAFQAAKRNLEYLRRIGMIE